MNMIRKEDNEEARERDMPAKRSKYQRSGLKPDQIQRHLHSLHNFMDKEKPYKNPELNVFSLAQMLGVSKNHLTQILNEHVGETFYEFINSYRVREAQELLRDPGIFPFEFERYCVYCRFQIKNDLFHKFQKNYRVNSPGMAKEE